MMTKKKTTGVICFFVVILTYLIGLSIEDTKTNPLHIPIIDLNTFCDNRTTNTECNEMQYQNILNIQRACEEYGLFYIKSPDFNLKFIDKQFELAEDFFQLPLSIKKAIPIIAGGFTRGYVPTGGESGSHRLEWKEAFSYGFPWPEDQAPSNPLQGPNIWPQEHDLPISWRIAMIELFEKFVSISGKVTEILSLALGVKEEESLSNYCVGGETISLMRLFHYFQYSNEESQDGVEKIGSSPHTDWGFLTVILQDSSGLQIQQGEHWIDIPSIPETLIVNCGDYLSLITNGQFKSPVHRVISPKDSPERFSFVFFYYPSYTAKINLESFLEQDNQCDNSEKGHNTLLDMSKGVDFSEVSFGEYVLGKWNGVYRN